MATKRITVAKDSAEYEALNGVAKAIGIEGDLPVGRSNISNGGTTLEITVTD